MHDSHFIDSEAQRVLDGYAAAYGDFSDMSLEELRAMWLRNAQVTAQPLPETVVDGRFDIPGPAGVIPCRFFRPRDAAGPLPILMLFISGTYVVTTLEYAGPNPPALVSELGCMVVTPLHRMPPEHRFPAAYDDCFAAFAWLQANGGDIGGDGKRIALVGESSAGTIAADICLRARDGGLAQPVLQVLAEPLLDHEAETPSANEFSFLLSKKDLRRGSAYYFGDERPPRSASPLLAPSVAGVAPAYIITAGLDPLRDEAIAYAARLRAANVIVAHRNHVGQIHGFFSFHQQVMQSRIAFKECCAVIRLAFDGGLLAI